MTKFVNLLGVGLLALALMGCTELMGILGQPTTPETKKQETVKTPAFSTPSGARTHKIDLGITSDTPDSTIWYTLDGSVPAADKGTSVKFSTAVPIYKNTTIKAIAVKKDWIDSGVAEASFTFETGPLGSIALNTSTVDFAGAATLPKLTMAYTGTGWSKIRYSFSSDVGGLPYILTDNAPATGNQLSLSINKYFANAKWTLQKIEMTGSTSQDSYEASQSGSNTLPLPVWEYYKKDPIATGDKLLKGTTYEGTRPSFTISGGGVADADPPLLSAVTITGTKTGLSGTAFKPEDTVTVTVNATDALSGIGNIKIAILAKDAWYQKNYQKEWTTSEEHLVDVKLNSDGKYEAQIKLGDNAYPFELYAKVLTRDMAGKTRFYYLDASKSTTDYSYYDQLTAVQDVGTLLSPALAVATIPYTSPLCVAAAASPGTPGDAWHSFTITPSEAKVYAYTIAANTRYYFQTNDGMGGGGTNSATGMGYYLIYGDGTPQSYGPTSGQNYNAAANKVTIDTGAKSGTFYVVANMKTSGTGSTFAHRLTTTAPTTP